MRTLRDHFKFRLSDFRVPMVAWGGALLVSLAASEIWQLDLRHSVLYSAIIIAAWAGGVIPGLVVTLLAVPVDVLSIGGAYQESSAATWIRAGFLLLNGIIISVLFMVVQRSLRHKRQAIEAAEAAKCQADQANSAKTRFLANISHEIRTPLGAILGFAELLRDDDLTHEERQQFVATILRNGEQLSQMLNDLLDLSKIESDRLVVERMDCNPVHIVEEVIKLLDVQAQAKGLSLRMAIEGQVPRSVKTDPTRLRQIMFNLIGNSIKFTEKGSIDVSIRLSGREFTNGRAGLEFLVRDTGIGIDPAQQALLFRPFAQADSSITRIYGGTGLGLVLAQRLAQALGGDLVLKESWPGQGSVFALTIDIGPVASLGAVSDEATRLLSAVSGNSAWPQLRKPPRVLLAEGDPDQRHQLVRLLQSAGVDLSCAEDGDAAVRLALKNHFDLILMNLQLLRGDGVEVVQALRQRDGACPVVALSTQGMGESSRLARSLEFDEVLKAPFKRDDFVALLAGKGHA